MATCRDLFLRDIALKLGELEADKARKACELLSYYDRAPSSIWAGPKGDEARRKYDEANQVLTDVKIKLKEV